MSHPSKPMAKAGLPAKASALNTQIALRSNQALMEELHALHQEMHQKLEGLGK